jgi:hypothetical protein
MIEPTAEAVSTGESSAVAEAEFTVFASSETVFVEIDVHVAGPEITKEPVPFVVELKVSDAPTATTVSELIADVMSAA